MITPTNRVFFQSTFKKTLTSFEDQIAFHDFEQAFSSIMILADKYPNFRVYLSRLFAEEDDDLFNNTNKDTKING
jgi:hypothetical protein